MTSSPLHMLTFSPLLFEKVWGGDRLSRFAKPVKPGAKIGESWELVEMGSTSASGAGGGAARSVIADGPLAGKTLREARSVWGAGLLGACDAKNPASANFPLLVKYLDARENLSVQVHPSPAYASAHRDCHLKTECWYILDAEPGAMIYKGVKPGVTRASFEKHIADGSCVDDLIAVPAAAGECHNLPSGTVHALGAGVLVAEVQTPSDTTFRVFDWGRTGRELHVKQSLACIDFGPAPLGTKLAPGQACGRHVTTEFFTLDEYRPRDGESVHVGVENHCCVVMVVAGSGTISAGAQRIEARAGTTVLVPASLSTLALIESERSMGVLCATIR
jgi:mannose-6-phosphate isomerase